jgi:tetratricopeptide (TPR) repeat protein
MLLAVVVAALLVGGFTWREPLTLAWLRRGPVAGLERYAAGNPDSAEAAATLARAYLAASRPTDAARVLTTVSDRYPENASVRVLLAQALYELGKTSEAYGHLQVVLNTLDPENDAARWWLGQVQERAGRPNEAYDTYEALVRRQPKHASALIRLGALATGDGRYSVAEEFYRRGAAVAPSNPEVASRHAEILFRLGRAEEAVTEARRAVKLAPEAPRGNFWLGRSLQVLDARGHGVEAEAALRKAASRSEQPYEARYFLAKLLRQLGRTNEAIQELERNTQENPLHQNSFYDLALYARSVGQTQRAEQAMSRFRTLNAWDDEGRQLETQVGAAPNDSQTRLRLARFYLKTQRPDLARAQVDQILRQDPHHAEARRLVQQIAAQTGPSPHSP